jgi:hypothetical protein
MRTTPSILCLLLASLGAPGCVTTRPSRMSAPGCFELTRVGGEGDFYRGCDTLFRCVSPSHEAPAGLLGFHSSGSGAAVLSLVFLPFILAGIVASASEPPPRCEPVATPGRREAGMVTDVNSTNTRWQER